MGRAPALPTFTRDTKMKIALLLLLVLVVDGQTVEAESVRDVSFSSTFDTNVFATSSDLGDYLTRTSAYFAHRSRTEESDGQLYYTGTAYLFARSTDRMFSVHGIGLSYSRWFGSRNRLHAGASFITRLDRDVFTVYDYAGFRVFANTKLYADPATMLRFGYHLETRNYWNLLNAGYADHYLFLQASRFLPTRTTVRSDISYSQKNQVGSEGQVVVGLQVAQSLFPGTGISLRYDLRRNVEPGVRDALEDEDILVDRYDYSGRAFTAQLTQQLPFSSKLVLMGGYERQRFDGQIALDADLIPLTTLQERVDRLRTFGAVLSLPLSSGLNAAFRYDFEQSQSNDATYDYDGRHIVLLGFDLNL